MGEEFFIFTSSHTHSVPYYLYRVRRLKETWSLIYTMRPVSFRSSGSFLITWKPAIETSLLSMWSLIWIWKAEHMKISVSVLTVLDNFCHISHFVHNMFNFEISNKKTILQRPVIIWLSHNERLSNVRNGCFLFVIFKLRKQNARIHKFNRYYQKLWLRSTVRTSNEREREREREHLHHLIVLT